MKSRKILLTHKKKYPKIQGEPFVWHTYEVESETPLTEREVLCAVRTIVKYGFSNNAGYGDVTLTKKRCLCTLCFHINDPQADQILVTNNDITLMASNGDILNVIPIIYEA